MNRVNRPTLASGTSGPPVWRLRAAPPRTFSGFPRFTLRAEPSQLFSFLRIDRNGWNGAGGPGEGGMSRSATDPLSNGLLLAACSSLFVVKCLLSAVRYPLSVVCCPLSAVRCLLSVARCPFSVFRCPLFAV